MPKIWLRYAQDMHEICPRYGQDMPKIWPRYAKDMSKIWPRYARDMPKICPRYAQVSQKSLKSRSKVSQKSPKSRSKVSQKSPKSRSKVHDAKASLLGLPDASFVVYLALNGIVWLVIWQSATGNSPPHHLLNPHLLAFLASAGPVVLAQLMVWTLDPHRPILYPFQRQALNIAIAHILSNMPSSGTPTELLPCIWFYLSSFVLGQSTHW